MNENNMDLSRARRQLHFSDYIYIHRASLSNIDRDAHMIVDKMINRQLHVPEFSFEYHVIHDELVSMFRVDDTMKCNYAVFGDVVSFDATFRTNKYDFVFVPFTGFFKSSSEAANTCPYRPRRCIKECCCDNVP
nr:hypothetical protein [Tanacetum cinerariifolium]